MEVVPLHIHEEFKEACAEILNEEWPRSMAARIHGLNQSCDTLPVCLAFLKRDSADTKVLGFSKLSAVQGISHAGLAESECGGPSQATLATSFQLIGQNRTQEHSTTAFSTLASNR